MCWGQFACTPTKAPNLVIATAANMQFAMEELVEAFSKQTQLPCETVVGSSGKLTAQIKEGAPFDVFVSANMKYPEDLYKNGFSGVRSRRNILMTSPALLHFRITV